MKTALFLYFLILFIPAYPQFWPYGNPEKDSITLFFVGDVMQHAPQITGARDSSGNYDYRHCFQYIRPYWEKADYVFANLETTLSDRNFSGYPQFCAPWHLARDLKSSGVDYLTTNNNHSCDKGYAGIRQTLYYLDSLEIPHTGTFTDTISWLTQTPLYIRHGSFKIALLSYTYGTNGIPVTGGQVVSMIDTFTMARQISKARLDTATHIIAIVHWGIEYQTTQNTEQEKMAAFLHAQGADIVIGSHPHVVQPMEYVTDGQDTCGITVYSLGNFISNQSKRYTNGGIGVQLQLIREKDRTRYDLSYLNCYVYRPVENGLRRYYVIPEPEAALLLGERDSVLYNQFFRDTDGIINQKAKKITTGTFSLSDKAPTGGIVVKP